jgi:hypothetical protein
LVAGFTGLHLAELLQALGSPEAVGSRVAERLLAEAARKIGLFLSRFII